MPRCSFLRQRLLSIDGIHYIASSFKHDIPQLGIKGEAEINYFPPRHEKGRLEAILVFVPGNPGLISYYVPFLTRLHSLIPSTHAIVSISHLGHSPRLVREGLSLIPSSGLSLEEQIACKVEFLRALRASAEEYNRELAPTRPAEGQNSRRPSNTIQICLIGHSVGAEMCVQTMKRIEDGSSPFVMEASTSLPNSSSSQGAEDLDASEHLPTIVTAFLLFPTLANIARTPNGRALHPIFHFPLIQLLPVLAYLLKPVIWILRLFADSDAATSAAPTASTQSKSSKSVFAPHPSTLSLLLSSTVIHHVLRLARSEMTTILEPDLEWYSRKDVKNRLWSYWGTNDGWVGNEGDEIKRVLATESEHEVDDQVVECRDNVPHAFCLAHSDIIAEKVATWVRAALPTRT